MTLPTRVQKSIARLFGKPCPQCELLSAWAGYPWECVECDDEWLWDYDRDGAKRRYADVVKLTTNEE